MQQSHMKHFYAYEIRSHDSGESTDCENGGYIFFQMSKNNTGVTIHRITTDIFVQKIFNKI